MDFVYSVGFRSFNKSCLVAMETDIEVYWINSITASWDIKHITVCVYSNDQIQNSYIEKPPDQDDVWVSSR